MRTPVFELHILPLFRAMDREHMSFAVDLSDYNNVVEHADQILERLEAADMPPADAGGPWPDEWVQLFRRWKDTGFKRLEVGTAQYTFRQTATAMDIRATGTFPATGYRGWLQIETETNTSKTYVLYFESPDASVVGNDTSFELRERYPISDARSVFIHDNTGVQQIH